MAQIASSELVGLLGGVLVSEGERTFRGLSTLANAGLEDISFLSNPAYKKHLLTTQAGLVLLTEEMAREYQESLTSEVVLVREQSPFLLILENPYLGYAKLSQLFDENYDFQPGVHPTAVVAKDVQVPPSACVGPYAVIEQGSVIGEGVYIGGHCAIGRGCRIGDRTRLWSSVVCYAGVKIGQDCIVHSGTVIGSDGFGNANDRGEWVKIAQLGAVTIKDNVEIGSNCSIDRGALDDTVIEDGVRIDNLVQIAHNVHIGKHTAIAGCVGIAGSTSIGAYCIVGGACGIGGHLEIADHVHMTGMTMVTKSIGQAGLYSSGTGVEPNMKWRKMVARMRNLDEMAKRLKQIENKVAALDS